MDELEALRLRDEVLQAMYWMSAEGIAQAPSERELSRFLALPEPSLAPYLARFEADALVEREGEGYRLSAEGERLGKRAFADEFAGLTGATHGECDESCWCHQDPEEAARCLDERTGRHVHG